jgi:hypothetical protein
MLKEQKELLARVRACERDALKLYNSGVKISGVVQKLRTASAELETRVRAIEKSAKPVAPPKPAATPVVAKSAE